MTNVGEGGINIQKVKINIEKVRIKDEMLNLRRSREGGYKCARQRRHAS